MKNTPENFERLVNAFKKLDDQLCPGILGVEVYEAAEQAVESVRDIINPIS